LGPMGGLTLPSVRLRYPDAWRGSESYLYCVAVPRPAMDACDWIGGPTWNLTVRFEAHACMESHCASDLRVVGAFREHDGLSGVRPLMVRGDVKGLQGHIM